jgi:hypothetical protein
MANIVLSVPIGNSQYSAIDAILHFLTPERSTDASRWLLCIFRQSAASNPLDRAIEPK